jgi:anthranilate phosphoribosyltransferase
MSLARYLKRLGREDAALPDLTEDEAHDLLATVLDGGASDLEVGAALAALRLKGESVSEFLGFNRALDERTYRLRAPPSPSRPLAFATYGGGLEEPNLLPLLALMLRRLGIAVLLHGTMEGGGRVASAYVLRELGILPCATLAQAQKAIDEEGLAFVPTAVLSPALAAIVALRNRLGFRNTGHILAKLLSPFHGESVRILGAAQPVELEKLEAILSAGEIDALLLKSSEDEPVANPRRRPRMRYFREGAARTLFDEEAAPSRAAPSLPEAVDAVATAEWTRLALRGRVPVPHPLVNQFACCLFASGYSEDFNQAKAIAAVEGGGARELSGGIGRRRGDGPLTPDLPQM